MCATLQAKCADLERQVKLQPSKGQHHALESKLKEAEDRVARRDLKIEKFKQKLDKSAEGWSVKFRL